MMHYGPCLELLGFYSPLGQFNGVQWKWLQSGFNRHQPLLGNLYNLWPHVLPFLRVRGDFFVRARSASVALGEAGLVFHVLLLEYASTFLLCLVPILVPFFPPFVHFLLCFYRKGKITFLTSLTKIMINPLSKCCDRMAHDYLHGEDYQVAIVLSLFSPHVS